MYIFDVIIVGGGNAALCAVIAAAKRSYIKNSSFRKFSKTMARGYSQHTRNLRSMHNKPTDALTDQYSEDEFFEDVLKVTKGQTNEEYARFVISHTPQAIEFAKRYGVRFQSSMKGTLHLGRTNAFFLGGGKSLINAYFKSALNKLGVKIFYEFEALELIIQQDTCEKILVLDKKQDKEVELYGKAFIIASGGFESNLEWLEEAWGKKARNFIIRGTRFNQGNMLKSL